MTRRGFTLLEVIIAIAVISILASMAVPYAAKLIDQSREESTRKAMEDLYATILGDPKIPTAGYVGDLGRLPQAPNFLRQLNEQLGQPAGGAGLLGVKFGWFGPYMNSGFDAARYRTDAWGTPYAYGNPGAGQIRSAGPDRAMGTADDLIYPPNAVNINGRLLVNLYVWHQPSNQYVLNPAPAAFPGPPPMAATVRFYYSNNGVQAFQPVGTPAAPPYNFVNFHSGFHAVWATCTLAGNPGAVTGQGIVYLPGNNQQAQLSLYLR